MKRPDETPVRRRTDVSSGGPEPSPGTPPQAAGSRQTGIGIIRPTDVDILKYANRYKRFLGLGTASPFDGYVSDLVPAILLNLLGLEDLFPEDQVGWTAPVVGAGGAGNFSYIGLLNPATPQGQAPLLVIVTYASAFPTAAVNLGLATDVAGITGQGSTFGRDSRRAWTGGLAVPQFITDNTHAVAQGGGNGPVQLKPSAGATSDVEWTGSAEMGFAVIHPGHNLAIVAQTANIGVSGEFRFRVVLAPAA